MHTTSPLLVAVDVDCVYKLCAIQSSKGRELLESVGKERGQHLSSVVLLQEGGLVFEKSTAVLKVLQGLGGLCYIVGSICLCVPTLVRDFVYDIVSVNRYKILGTRDVCRRRKRGDRTPRFLS